MFDEENVGPNDITSTREINLENGNILRAFRENPYGFIRFKLDKGQLPDFMQGSFTSYSEAEKAIQQYMTYRQFEAEKVSITSKENDKLKKIA